MAAAPDAAKSRNHWKPLQNIAILGGVISAKATGVRIIEKVLVILGISVGPGAGTMGNPRNH